MSGTAALLLYPGEEINDDELSALVVSFNYTP
jgi:hypothetical protein